MRAVLFALALVASPALLLASDQQDSAVAESTANPIRKVVTMLQKMQTTIEAEGEKEKDLFDKFMCYCKNGAGALSASIASANTNMPELASDIEAGEGCGSWECLRRETVRITIDRAPTVGNEVGEVASRVRAQTVGGSTLSSKAPKRLWAETSVELT